MHTQPQLFALTAVCDLREDLLKAATARYGCKGYTSVDALLADPDIELVSIALPTFMHHDFALKSLQTRKHTVVEKPMVMTVRDADDLIAAAQANRVLLTTYQNRRHYSCFRKVQELLAAGTIGRVFRYETGAYGWGAVRPPRDAWRHLPGTGGSPIWDFGAHLVDEALVLFPNPVAVWGEMHRVFRPDEEDRYRITLFYPSDLVVEIGGGAGDKLAGWRYHILGNRGSLKMEAGNEWGDMTVVLDREGGDQTLKPESPGGSILDAGQRYYRTVHATLRENAPLAVPPALSRQVVAIIQGALHSAATKTLVRL
jgi:scyllo-inositol 2-dehydrogenase (NADP+)